MNIEKIVYQALMEVINNFNKTKKISIVTKEIGDWKLKIIKYHSFTKDMLMNIKDKKELGIKENEEYLIIPEHQVVCIMSKK